jgi:hypothetical protein
MDEKQLQQIVDEIDKLTNDIYNFYTTEISRGGTLNEELQQALNNLKIFTTQALQDPAAPDPVAGIVDSLDKLTVALARVRDALELQENRLKQGLGVAQIPAYQEFYQKINNFHDRIDEIRNKLISQTPGLQAKKLPTSPSPTKKLQPSTSQTQKLTTQPTPQQPTLVNLKQLTRAVEAFEELITILNSMADKIPGTADINAHSSFLLNTYSSKQYTIWQLIEKIRKFYPDLPYAPDRAEEFLKEAHRRLIEDTYKWEQHIAESAFKANITAINISDFVELSSLGDRLDNITQADIVRAAYVLESGERATSEIYQFIIQELTPQAPKNWKEGLKYLGLKILSWVSRIPLTKPARQRFQEKVGEVMELVTPKLAAAQGIQKEPRPPHPAFRFLSDERRKKMFAEMEKQGAISRQTLILTLYDGIKALWNFLWLLPELPPHSGWIPIDKLDPAVFGPLEPAVRKWKEKGIKVREALDNYVRRRFIMPSEVAVIGKEIERMKQVGLDKDLPEFIEASKELVRKYKQLPDDEKTKYVNFERLLFRPDGLPLLERLVAFILLGQQVSKSAQSLLQALPPRGDRERQQWLIEEKHTL